MLNNSNLIIFGLLLAGCCSLICATGQLGINLSKVDFPETTAAEGAAPVTTLKPPQPSLNKTSSTSTTTTTTSTTTPKPTTTSTTTTPKPTTTTAKPEPKPTTPAPTPDPKPKAGTWNCSCILVKMAIQLNVTYETQNNKTNHTLYNVPDTAVVFDSHCESDTTQFMQINWGTLDAPDSMLLQFDTKDKSSIMTMIRFVLTSDNFPNAKPNQTIQLIHRNDEFDAPVKMSYHCTHPQTFNLTETVDSQTLMGTVTVSDVQTEAFRKSDAKGFSAARDCDGTGTSDIVPIAVGVALAALIAIVLISYLCARRRSTSRGYMSF